MVAYYVENQTHDLKNTTIYINLLISDNFKKGTLRTECRINRNTLCLFFFE